MKKTTEQKMARIMSNNDYDWYAVLYDDDDIKTVHHTGLSSILQCGHDPAEYGIVKMYRCGMSYSDAAEAIAKEEIFT